MKSKSLFSFNTLRQLQNMHVRGAGPEQLAARLFAVNAEWQRVLASAGDIDAFSAKIQATGLRPDLVIVKQRFEEVLKTLAAAERITKSLVALVSSVKSGNTDNWTYPQDPGTCFVELGAEIFKRAGPEMTALLLLNQFDSQCAIFNRQLEDLREVIERVRFALVTTTQIP